ncbi:hypothetical protein [Deinococcus radiophilus]|uniref:hypothetical protein n=1 Tax=Deinococcus radiophilus TaxID=32062 RepID=UPI000F8459D6|nr:hypothetical protein [Deinococcus radiophilus]
MAALASGPRNAYQVGEQLGWHPRLAKDVARRLHKAGRLTRSGAGLPGEPYLFHLPSARRQP